jgi:hypothetical protein
MQIFSVTNDNRKSIQDIKNDQKDKKLINSTSDRLIIKNKINSNAYKTERIMSTKEINSETKKDNMNNSKKKLKTVRFVD